jgi:signal transduction histidine kinase
VAAPLPANETERLQALRSLEILDTEREAAYDDIALLAAEICEAPIAVINFIDADRQWGKAIVGLADTEAPRTDSFCAHTICGEDVLVVRDTLEDTRFADNPMVLDDPNLRFYAGAPLVTPEGYALGTVCVADRRPREIGDDRLAALAALARQVVAQLELRKALGLLRVQNEQLRELDRMKDVFIATASHELRTPLTSVVGFVKLLLRDRLGPLGEQQREALVAVDRSAGRLIEMVNDLLLLARADADHVTLERAPTRLDELVEQSAQAFGPNAAERSIELDLSLHPVELDADPAKLAQLIDNLVGNAIKFSPPSSRVELRAFSRNGTAVLEVEDEGIGIPEAERRVIFDRFARATSAHEHEIGGTGLGLAVAKTIADLHGGRIACDAAPGGGSVFTVELPLAD